MTTKIIEISNLEKSFDKFKAVDQISFDVKQGEILGLLGPNGAGKTTTIKILTGLLKHDQGQIKILDTKIENKIPAWIKGKMGVVFEESNLYLRLSAWDNLKLFAGINDVSDKKIKEILTEYQLLPAAKKEVKSFSKGMKKRLMICRALLSEPEILILDEATGGLDPISAEIIREKVLKLKAEGKTVILSTHYLEEADRLCDKIAFINKGKLLALDKPAAFKNSFENEYLQIKYSIENTANEKNKLQRYLENILDAVDDYDIDKDILNLKLKIDNKTFKKADKIAAKFEVMEINKIETNLQQVFKEINN